MTDLELTAMWIGILGAGVAAAFTARALHLATTYVRDMLHIGAGVWVLGWPHWHGLAAPLAIAGAVAVGLALVPAAAGRIGIARRFYRAVTNGDERFAGLIVYGGSYLALTVAGLAWRPFPAAAALLALSLGDGIGGAVGRRFGRRAFRTPFGKRKTLEGSVTVAAAAACGAVAAAALFDVALGPASIAILGVVAALAEAIAPRSSDNVVVPAAVWGAAMLM